MKKLLIPLLALSLAGCDNQSLWDNPFSSPKIVASGYTVKQKGYEVLVGDLTPVEGKDAVLFTYYVAKTPPNTTGWMTCIVKGANGSLIGGTSAGLQQNLGSQGPIRLSRIEKNSKLECNIG